MRKKITERREKILEMRNQGKTLQEIGDTIGVTRERIRQILKNTTKNLHLDAIAGKCTLFVFTAKPGFAVFYQTG